MTSQAVKVLFLFLLMPLIQGCFTTEVLAEARNRVRFEDPISAKVIEDHSIELICLGTAGGSIRKEPEYRAFRVVIPISCMNEVLVNAEPIVWPDLDCAHVEEAAGLGWVTSPVTNPGKPAVIEIDGHTVTIISGRGHRQMKRKPWKYALVPLFLVGDFAYAASAAVVGLVAVPLSFPVAGAYLIHEKVHAADNGNHEAGLKEGP